MTAVGVPPPMNVAPATRRLRIAIVYSRSPVPMVHADQMTVAHLIAFLSARGHDVDLFAVAAGGAPDEQQQAWLRDTCRSIHLFAHGPRDLLRGVTSMAIGMPAQVALFSNPAQRAAVAEAVDSTDYDIVYTYYFRSAEITKHISTREGLKRPRTFLAMQLSQTLNTRRIARNAPTFSHRLFYRVESELVARYEARIWQHFDRVVLIGPSDADAINQTCAQQGRGPIDNIVFCAHGVDVTRFRPRPDIVRVPDRLVFSGVMKTPTNVQAAQWFVNRVWPLIRVDVPQASFDIVGRSPSAEVLALGAVPGVRVIGAVPDTAVPIASASVCINPMQAGGGMQNKLIEYLSSAKPVVATRVANEGIGAIPGRDLLIADTPQEFARAVVGLLKDAEARDRLGSAARRFVVEDWTWEAHFLKLEAAFYDALDGD